MRLEAWKAPNRFVWAGVAARAAAVLVLVHMLIVADVHCSQPPATPTWAHKQCIEGAFVSDIIQTSAAVTLCVRVTDWVGVCQSMLAHTEQYRKLRKRLKQLQLELHPSASSVVLCA